MQNAKDDKRERRGEIRSTEVTHKIIISLWLETFNSRTLAYSTSGRILQFLPWIVEEELLALSSEWSIQRTACTADIFTPLCKKICEGIFLQVQEFFPLEHYSKVKE